MHTARKLFKCFSGKKGLFCGTDYCHGAVQALEKARLKVHVKGRVTIPKKFRKRLGIVEGDYVEAVLREDQRAVVIHVLAKDWLEDMLNTLRKVFPNKSTEETMKSLRQGWEEYATE